MADKTVLLGLLIELGTDIGDGILKRNAGNTAWEQVLPKDILAAASGDISVNNQKLTNLADVALGSGGNRVIKIADNDNQRSLTMATGDSAAAASGPLTLKSGSGLTDSGDVLLVSGDASQASAPSGDVRVDVGAPGSGGTAGVLKLGDVNVSAVTLGRTGKTVSVPGALTVTEALIANGAVTLGDGAGDDVTITGSIASDLTFKAAARVIKIADNDNLRSLTIKTGDEVTPSTGSGDLILDVGAAAASAGKLTLGAANASEVIVGKSDKKLAFFGATAIVQNATEFTLNTNSNLSYNLPDGATTLEVEKCLRQLLTYLGNVSGLGLVHVHVTT